MEKDFFKLINNAVFGNTMENVEKHRDIKLVTTERKRNYLVSVANYYTTKLFTENLLAIEIKKTQKITKKPMYLDLLTVDISKTVMYEFWYDYIKSKNSGKSRLCYMDTDSFIVNIKTNDIYKYILEDLDFIASRSDTSSYDVDRPMPMG